MHIRYISDESVGQDLSGIFMIWCWATSKSVKAKPIVHAMVVCEHGILDFPIFFPYHK